MAQVVQMFCSQHEWLTCAQSWRCQLKLGVEYVPNSYTCSRRRAGVSEVHDNPNWIRPATTIGHPWASMRQMTSMQPHHHRNHQHHPHEHHAISRVAITIIIIVVVAVVLMTILPSAPKVRSSCYRDPLLPRPENLQPFLSEAPIFSCGAVD